MADRKRKKKEPVAQAPVEPLKKKEYEKQLKQLHVELVQLQQWVVHKGLKVCIVFEGRDGAGKGGTIKAITERVSPRIFRVVALPAPTEREKSQMYAQRYLPHFPAAGEVVIFDRSWYNRAGVERVMGFCSEETSRGFLKMVPLFEKLMIESGIILLKYWLEVSPEEQTQRFLDMVPGIEKAMVDSGIILVKYWLEVSAEEQQRRLEDRVDDGRKIWKLSPIDTKSYDRWDEYTRARDEMFAASDTAWAPWFVADSNDKKRARLNIISHLLSKIPYERAPREKIKLPKRSSKGEYNDRATIANRNLVPEKF